MAQQESMNMVEFMKRFDSEEKCREYLYHIRWPEGFVCPKCGVQDKPFCIKSRHKYQCRHCSRQTSVTAGTIMDRSRTPLVKWFLAIYLISQDKRGCSAMKLKQELGVAYDTAWTMSHKIRHAMGNRDSLYMLSGTVEVDDAFFGGAHEGSKRGRGTDKTAVVLGLSLNKNGRPEYVRAKVVDHVDGENLVKFAKEEIAPGSTIRCDGYSAYGKLSENSYRVDAENYDPRNDSQRLKWLHVIISNAKAFIAGTYHGLNGIHLQAFLDEFCYRFNRRFWSDQLLPRTLAACMRTLPFTRYALIG